MAQEFTHAQLFRRHGAGAYSRFAMARLFRRWLGIEICIISVSDNSADYSAPNGFRMECLHKDLPLDLSDPAKHALDAFLVTHEQTLAKGHHAVVTIDSSSHQVVGHNFYARSATPVNDTVYFQPGGTHFYSYGAHTDPEYRGLRLSPARWTWFREWRLANSLEPSVIFYVALDNLASLASGTGYGRTVLGYSAWRRGTKAWCYRSAGVERLGVGFFPDER